MQTRENTCCFTGHRPTKLPWADRENDPRCLMMQSEIADQLELLYQLGYRYFICGMAEGCDLYFAQIVLAMRKEHPDMRLEAAIPCEAQTKGWKQEVREEYEYILRSCDTVTYVQRHYTRDCMMRRNHYMVDRSSALLACFNGLPGGTMNTIHYAYREGLRVITIPVG